MDNQEKRSFMSLLENVKKREKVRKKSISDEERNKQTKEWCTFWRRNWDLYATEELGLPLFFFQQVLLYLICISESFFEMCSRGLTKSFIAGVAGVIQCMLYPNSEVVLTSKTMKTAKKMVQNKIENELCKKMSPKLKYLYDIGQIKFDYNQEEIRVSFLFNNSWILILPEADSSLGERACMLIFEETRIMKQYFVDSVFMPMSRPRQAEFLLKPEYQDKQGKPLSMYVEPCKKIYLTSTKYKYMWFWNRWKKVVEGTINSEYTNVRYNFFCGDIFTAIEHGIKTEKDLEEYRATMSESELRMEIYNEPIGEVEGSFYELEDFKRNSIISNSFVPPTYEEFVFKYLKGTIPFFRPKNEGEKRVIYVDFAFADTVKESQSNDQTVIGCMSGYPNENMDKFLRNCEYMETYSGGKKDESILRIRELFYFYDADYLIVDLRNGGEDRWIDLSKPFYHEQLGIEMRGFGILQNNDILTRFCENSKVENLRGRVIDNMPHYVTIPVIGTDERNNNFHVAMKNALKEDIIRFLMDEVDLKNELEEDVEFLTMDSEEKTRRLLGHVQLNLMMEEAVKLQQEISKGFIKLSESKRTDTKDRIVSTEYANYLFTLLEQEMIKNNQGSDDDLDGWEFLSGNFGYY